MVPTLWTIMNSSYNYEYYPSIHEYWENIHLGVELTPAKHFCLQTDVQHSFTYAVYIFSFNILVSCNPEFVSFFRTFYWSTTYMEYFKATNNNKKLFISVESETLQRVNSRLFWFFHNYTSSLSNVFQLKIKN